jgi:uncharacterized lipoprotein YmbA
MKHEVEAQSPPTFRSAAAEEGKSEAQSVERRSHCHAAAHKMGSNSSLATLFRLPVLARLLLALAAGLSLTGCFGFLKPAKPTARHFVLTSLPAAEPAAAPHGSVAVGIGPVKLAAYLFNTSFAVRNGTNEIVYLSSVLWAERLDTGLQRVLAADLATLLPTDQVRLSAWQSADVSVEVYVAIERFDVDAQGHGVLAAWWRILSPGGEKIIKAGETRLTRQGPPPDADPSGAVATLSELAADLSRQLAQAVKETTGSQTRR